ncbi:MAG: amidohydrolase family protein [Clostridia bacterium]|nr:amidohydrolase family protein [Clostridia bacterium]
MKKFADTHVHVKYEENEKTIAMFDEIKSKGVTDIAIQCLVKFEDYGILQNLAALNYKKTYERLKIRVFGNIDDIGPFSHIPYERQAEALLDMGCDGIKMLNGKPDTRKLFGKGLDHESYDKMFSLLEERGTPVLIHSGDPETNWDVTKVSPNVIARGWFYGDGTFLTPEEIYAEKFRMLDKHPKLNVTFAHFFFLSNKMDEARRVFETYPNVKFDLTPGGEMFYGFSKDIDAWHDFFEEYSDRLLFGTDSYSTKDCNSQISDLVLKAITHDRTEFSTPCYGRDFVIKGLDLCEETVDKIKYKNFERFVGSEPAAIDIEEMKKAANAILKVIKDDPNEKHNVLWIEKFCEEN